MHENAPILQELKREQLNQAGQISTIMNHLDDMRKDQILFKEGMARILFLIDNDHGTGQKGIVAKQMDIDGRIDKLEKFEDEIKQKVGIGVFIGGVIFSIVSFLAKFFIVKS